MESATTNRLVSSDRTDVTSIDPSNSQSINQPSNRPTISSSAASREPMSGLVNPTRNQWLYLFEDIEAAGNRSAAAVQGRNPKISYSTLCYRNNLYKEGKEAAATKPIRTRHGDDQDSVDDEDDATSAIETSTQTNNRSPVRQVNNQQTQQSSIYSNDTSAAVARFGLSSINPTLARRDLEDVIMRWEAEQIALIRKKASDAIQALSNQI